MYFGLKGFFVTIWTPPSEATTYSIRGADGRNLTIVFLPGHKTLFHYTRDNGKSIEASLTEMKGTYGTHYVWRLWSVKGPGKGEGFFGYRIYPEGARPVVMQTTVLKKFMHGTAKPVLPIEGERTHGTMLFFGNAVAFEGMTLSAQPTDQQFVRDLLAQLAQ